MRKKLLHTLSLFFVIFLTSAQSVFACGLSFNPSQVISGRPLYLDLRYDKVFPNDPNQRTFTVSISIEGRPTGTTFTKTVTSGSFESFMAIAQPLPGQISAYATNSDGSDHCSANARAISAPPPGGSPPPSSTGVSSIGSPKTWLSSVLPGIIPGASGGMDFITKNLVPFITGTLLFLIILGSLIYLIVGGFMWLTSQGNKEGLAKAKSAVMHALIGLGLGVASFLVIAALGKFLGGSFLGGAGMGTGTSGSATCAVSTTDYNKNCLITGPLSQAMQSWCNYVRSACGY